MKEAIIYQTLKKLPQPSFVILYNLGREDIKLVVDRLLYDDDKHLTRAETTGVIDNLLKEVDNDEDGAICFPEFQQAMQKVLINWL